MKRFLIKIILLVSMVLGAFIIFQASSVQADWIGQIPTVDIPTVTGTPHGSTVRVRPNGEEDQINVRAGPSTVWYEAVGVLVIGQQVPALGQTAGGDWIEIAYPGAPDGVGWVYKPLVELDGSVPIIEPPPTPTPRTTPTIDPTLAAQFLVDIPPTRLPTFTPPPPLNIPTFQTAAAVQTSRVPMGLVIIGMAVVGIFGLLISFLRGR